MVIALTILCIVGLCGALYPAMLDKPFSEDDGQWFYTPLLRHRIASTHEEHRAQGVFGIPFIFGTVFRFLRDPGAREVYAIKAVWYGITACSVYWLTLLVWSSPLTAALAAGFFVVATVLPSTLFFFTYGEHFYLLPVNVSLGLSLLGADHGLLAAVFLAGLLSAWANQIKITTLPITLITPLLFLGSGGFLPATAVFVLGYCVVTIVPLLFFKSFQEMKDYLHSFYGPVLLFFLILARNIPKPRKAEKTLRKVAEIASFDGAKTPYSEAMITQARNRKLDLIVRHMAAPARDMSLPLLLCLTQLPAAMIQGGEGLLPVGLLAVSILIQQCQQNYHRPHFNPIWVPVGMLAAKSATDLAPMAGSGLVAASLLAVGSSLWLGWIGLTLFRARRANERYTIGDIEPRLSFLFKYAEKVGQELQAATEPRDRLLVWGDQPSIYLYAKRLCLDPRLLFIYAHHGRPIRQNYLFSALAQTPPEYILFYNWRTIDEWDMDALQDHAMIPYAPAGEFIVPGDDGAPYVDEFGIVWKFPLYRRDDAGCYEALMDRGQFLCKLKGPGYDIFTQADQIRPGLPEAALKYDFWKNRNIRPGAMEQTDALIRDARTTEEIVSLLHVKALIAFHKNDHEQEMAIYDQILKLAPGDCRALAESGGLALRKGDIAQATRKLAKALAFNPCSITATANFAMLMRRGGDMDKYAAVRGRCTRLLDYLGVPQTTLDAFEKAYTLEADGQR